MLVTLKTEEKFIWLFKLHASYYWCW